MISGAACQKLESSGAQQFVGSVHDGSQTKFRALKHVLHCGRRKYEYADGYAQYAVKYTSCLEEVHLG